LLPHPPPPVEHLGQLLPEGVLVSQQLLQLSHNSSAPRSSSATLSALGVQGTPNLSQPPSQLSLLCCLGGPLALQH
jgi:hypothetical protein